MSLVVVSVVLCALLFAGTARADSGTVSSYRSASGELVVMLQFTVDSCTADSPVTPGLGCAHTPQILEAAVGVPCASDDPPRSAWRIRSGNGAFSDSFVLPSPGASRLHLCAWVKTLGFGPDDRLLAELIVEPPVSSPPPPPPPAPAPAALPDRDCDEFRSQEEAQTQLLPGDPYGLDADRDGRACEELPLREGARLGKVEAEDEVRQQLADRYGRTWTGGRARRVACNMRVGAATRGCRASWTRKRMRYRANIVIQEHSTFYRVSVRIVSRKRI